MPLDPKKLMYAPTHEWVHLEPSSGGLSIATVGISDFAVQALTDLVHIDLPAAGKQVAAGTPFGEVESVKAVSDLYSPVDGEITEVNSPLADHLDWLNTDAYGVGWLIKVHVKDQASLAKLLDYDAYKKQCEQES